MVARKRTLIINVWFGDRPAYLNYFTKTLESNPDFNWLLVSDQPELIDFPDNLITKPMTIRSFSKLTEDRLGFPVNIRDPIKLCDFKPVYGRIFEHYLENYDYWGYCDLDLVFGNLSKFVSPLTADEPDVVSFYRGFLSGPFCLFRKNDKTINLYRKIPSHRTVLQSPDHHAFDENNLNRVRRCSWMKTAGLKARYLGDLVFRRDGERTGTAETAYQFQWYLKKYAQVPGRPEDMTDMVHQESRQGGLTTRFAGLLKSDREFRRMGRKAWHLVWDRGNLRDEDLNREIFAFHFVDLKTRTEFKVPDSDPVPERFSLTGKGFEI